MTRLFTVKDFITYNNPCFSCGKKIAFEISIYHNGIDRGSFSYRTPIVLANYTEIDLKITYIDAVKLYIFHKDNKILSNNQSGLSKYLSDHRLSLRATCSCHSEIASEDLDFSLTTERQYVAAVRISFERLSVTEGDNNYHLISSFPDNKSVLTVWKTDRVTGFTNAPTTIEMPLIPKYKFRDREHFLEKMKLYTLFS